MAYFNLDSYFFLINIMNPFVNQLSAREMGSVFSCTFQEDFCFWMTFFAIKISLGSLRIK